jgi:hypothetical protein
MEHESYCFLYDRRQAGQVFRKIDDERLILAILAVTPPDPAWDGCTVFGGDPGPEHQGLVCVGTRGPMAAAAQERLIEAFESHGVVVQQVFEGGPPAQQTYAHAGGGAWKTGPEENG